MDTSEIYIKMCACPEIQDYPHQTEPEDFLGNGSTGMFGVSIWLPRQDQLQAMVIDIGCGNSFQLIHGMNSFLREYPQPIGSTMEQLWLAFVMHELYQKHWTGERWDNGS